MRSVAEHQALVAGLLRRPAPVRTAVPGAAGRVLARDCLAGRAIPEFDNSAMDGYAVHSADISTAARHQPVTLPVLTDIPAGREDLPPLSRGAAYRIMTGAPVPPGADTVVPVEATDGGASKVQIYAAAPPGRHIRKAGENLREGQQVLAAGTVLQAGHLGLLGALGLAEVWVTPPQRALVLSTGSELTEPGKPLLPGHIYDANTAMLAAAVTEAGAQAAVLPPVPDDVAGFHAAVAGRLAEADVIITSGGVSAGAFEVVKEAMAGSGVTFARVAMRPGSPQGAGYYHGVPVVALPGNPASALVSFEVFVRPALRAAMGLPRPHRRVVSARLAEPLRSPPGRRHFLPAILAGDEASVRPAGAGAGSSFVAWLSAPGAMMDIPGNVTFLEAGAAVDVWVLD